MTTIAAGNTAEIYVPLTSSLTFTPGTGGTMRLGFAVQSGAAAVAPQIISAATTVSVSAGATVFAQAVNAAATYTDPAESGPAIQALVSGNGVLGIGGREQTFDGAPIPDPRKRAGMSGLFATQSTSSGYLDPTYSRRIVVTLDISATTSGVTAAGGQDLTLFPTATAAGFRWDEPNRSFRSATSQANNSLAVITIKEA